MTTPELIDYIKKTKQRGIDDATIAGILKNNGWGETDISEAFATLPKEIFSNAVPPTSKQFLSEQNAPPKNPVDSEGIFVSQFQKLVSPELSSEKVSDLLESKPKSGGFRKLLLVLIILVCIAALGGLGYYAYGEYFGLSSEQKIIQSFKNLANVTSSRIKTSLSVDVDQSNFKITLDGEFQGKTFETLQQKSLIAINAHYTPPPAAPASSTPLASTPFKLGEMDLGIAFETRIKDKNLYVQLTDIPELLSLFGLGRLKGQWVIFPLTDLKNKADTLGKQKNITSENLLTKEEIAAIEEKYKDVQKLTAEKVGVEIIESLKTDHYEVSINKTTAEAYLSDFAEASLKKGAASQEEIEKSKKDIAQTLDSFSSLKTEVWVGKKDMLPYKIKIVGTATPPEGQMIEKGEIKIDAEMTFYDFNEEVSVETPLESKNIEEILSQIESRAGTSTPLSESSRASTSKAQGTNR